MYGMYGVYSRLIGPSFGNFNQNWLRNIIVALIAGLVIIVSRTSFKSIQQQDIRWIVLWFLSGSWVTVLTFIAFNHLPLGTVYLIIYSAMITSGFLSGKIFFQEKMNLTKTVSLFLALVGLAIIYRFSLTGYDLIYAFMCLVSGLMTGVWNTISKKFSDHYSNMQMVFMDALASIVAALIGAILFNEVLPRHINPSAWGWLIIYAITQVVDVGLVVFGFKNLDAQIGSIILPVEIIFATIFALLFFGEYPSFSSIIGGLMIVSAAVLPSLEIIINPGSNCQDR